MTELSRPLPPDRVGSAGLEQTVEAGPEELVALARRLMIPAVLRLRCEFRLRREAEGAIEAEGRLEAEVVRVCVVTLEEFAQAVDEAFHVRFVPAGTETEDDDPDSPDQIPYRTTLDLGEAAAEQLALALDPYPRRPDAPEMPEAEAEGGGAFAGLAALRRPH